MPSRRIEEQVAKNDATFREANERVAATADGLMLEDEPVPFICECASTECFDIVRLRLDEYRHVRSSPCWFLNVPGHEAAAQGAATVVERHAGYVIVEKLGRAAEVVQELAAGSEAREER